MRQHCGTQRVHTTLDAQVLTAKTKHANILSIVGYPLDAQRVHSYEREKKNTNTHTHTLDVRKLALFLFDIPKR